MKRMVRLLMCYLARLQIERLTEKNKRKYHSKTAAVFEGRVDAGYAVPHQVPVAPVADLTAADLEAPAHF